MCCRNLLQPRHHAVCHSAARQLLLPDNSVMAYGGEHCGTACVVDHSVMAYWADHWGIVSMVDQSVMVYRADISGIACMVDHSVVLYGRVRTSAMEHQLPTQQDSCVNQPHQNGVVT